MNMKRLTIRELEDKAAELAKSNDQLRASTRTAAQGNANTMIAKEFVKTNDLVVALMHELIALRKELGQ